MIVKKKKKQIHNLSVLHGEKSNLSSFCLHILERGLGILCSSSILWIILKDRERKIPINSSLELI